MIDGQQARAVITTGGRIDGAFARAAGTTFKALAPFRAGLLVDPIIGALRACGIDDIAVVAGPEVSAALHGRDLRFIDGAADGIANVERALDAWPEGDVIYATSDLPFVTAPDLAAFIDASRAFALTMPLADADAYERAFPRAPAHLTTVGGERVANGSVFYIGAGAREPLRAVAGRFFAARKSALGMARLLGPALLLRFLLGRLRIADVERRGCAELGCRVAAIRGAAPALCYDVDSLTDYADACARG
jgi:GTP:adenosylcobinamide-phosphate guanylyltransferase